MKKVSIVVLNYKTYEETIDCLKSLFKITYPNHEIIVVDNASGNNSLDKIGEFLEISGRVYSRIDSCEVQDGIVCKDNLILFQSPSNRGYSAGNNWGIKIALGRKADYVLILNNDTIVEPGFLDPLVDFADNDEKIGAVGPKIVGVDGKIDYVCARGRLSFWGYCRLVTCFRRFFLSPRDTRVSRGLEYGEYKYDKPKRVDTLSGACIMMRSSIFSRIGLLDENVFLMLEELILTEKFISAGLDSWIVPSSSILHKGSGTIGKEPSKAIKAIARESRDYYMKNYRHWNWMQRRFLMFEPPLSHALSVVLKMTKGR